MIVRTELDKLKNERANLLAALPRLKGRAREACRMDIEDVEKLIEQIEAGIQSPEV